MREILQSYLRRLTNLSGTSRSIFLPKLLAGQCIDIHEFDFALKKTSFKILEGILARESKIPLCEIQNSRDENSNVLSQKLKKLKRVDRLIFEEQGTRDLHIGWPFVKGKFSDSTLVRCPLIYFPVVLESDNNQWSLRSRKDVNATMNKSFLLAHAYFNEVKANEKLLGCVFDDFDKESRGFRTDLYELLREAELEINFNQDNFKDELKSFKSYQRTVLEASEKKGELKLFPEMVLGVFPQADSCLMPDYMTMLENPKLSTLEQFFAEKNLDKEKKSDASYYSFLKKVKEEQTFTPFVVDAYQENVIKAIKKGNSVVVQGPPGTGKSQLICNLVADYIARGKNVLVVSQKRAALDVVFQRLKEKELGNFIGLLHDFKNDKKSIYQQLEHQIGSLANYLRMNNSLEAIHLERSFLKASRRIDQIDEQMSEFKSALFDESECGLSVKELYLTSSLGESVVDLKLEYRKFNFHELDGFIRKLKTYAQYGAVFLNENHPWFTRRSFATYQASDLQQISRQLTEIKPYIKTLESVTEEAIGRKVQFEDAIEIIKKEKEIDHLLLVLKDKTVFNVLGLLMKNLQNTVSKDWLSKLEKIVMQSYVGNGPEFSLKAEQLGAFQKALKRSLDARNSFFKWMRWKIFSKDKIFITRTLVNNNLKSSKSDFTTLVEKVDSRLNLEHNLSKIKAETVLSKLPNSLSKIEIKNWFFYQKQGIESQVLLNKVRHMNEYVSPTSLNHQKYISQLQSLLKALQPISAKLKEWGHYLSIPQLRSLFAGQQDAEHLIISLKKDFDSLCEFDKLQEELSEEERGVFKKLDEGIPRVNFESWFKLFDNSLRITWIDHIELKYPVLRTVSSRKFEDLETELQECVKQKLKISTEMLLLKLRGQVCKNVQYNRLKNRITYRDLHHQVTKKRRIWAVRKLMSNFSREIFDLMPCWLASPESVSAIFPMEKTFDLVVFDEASQCFVEKGIPAMFRGKQVVIAGDDKQLKPNDLYKVRWEQDNNNDLVELDFDSLLNLGSQYLMQTHLNGHYRSKNPDLIRFSNEHFYDNRLMTLPDFNEMNGGKTAIDYIKVEGCWQKSTNLAEAQQVGLLVYDLLKKHPGLEIGVVTFNATQQMFIIDYLEQFFAEKQSAIPESLIVKNIENIQGDEKDVIIFSTVYAPDTNGKMNMNFGSLNMDGGENRLNVAITRAREKIYLVTSIMPQELKVDKSKNQGPKLLKKYLEYAHAISNHKFVPYTQRHNHHEKNWYLKSKIINMDFNHFPSLELQTSLPFVDLTLKYNQKYLATLITDDEQYHQDISIKASHVYKPSALRQKKWVFSRIASRQYWIDPESVKESINRLISRSIDG